MFKSGIFIIAAIFLAGCAGNSVRRLPPSEAAGNTSVIHAFPTPQSPKPSQPFPSNPTPGTSEPAAPPQTAFTSLDNWAKTHHVGSPKRLNDLPVAAYSIATKNGTMVLEIGSREASWNGTEITLGFAPQVIDGEVSLYGVDLQKNLATSLKAINPPGRDASTLGGSTHEHGLCHDSVRL